MSAKKPAPTPNLPATPVSPGEADYAAIHAAVLATERGRWFLAEYARRNRQSEAAELLAGIERVGAASLDAGRGIHLPINMAEQSILNTCVPNSLRWAAPSLTP